METMRCPHCGAAVHKNMIFDRNGKASRGSGNCNSCHKHITWWGENGRPRIAKG